jgi:Leucine-rich repeat (LRR) protein
LEPVFENATLKNPAFQKWMNDVVKLTVEKQVEAVVKKLQELNPGFDGTVTPTIEKGVVTKLEFVTDNVTDISPVRALAGLKVLHVTGSGRGKGKLADLSSLKGMPLSSIELNDTQVSDLSPLKGMNLTMVLFTPKNITEGLDVIRQMKSLTNIGIGWGDKDQFPPDEFWHKYDAGQFGKPGTTAGTPDRKPITTIDDPAEKQVEAIAKKLQELNRGFDGNETHKVEDGVVTELQFVTDNVTDISPVRALNGLKKLQCAGSGEGNGILSDLSPLRGMPLTQLMCERTKVSDLSSLRGMPLTNLSCGRTQVSDLSPLKGMHLTELYCQVTKVSDLSPLKGMTLTKLFCDRTKVSDLSPLEGMPLADLRCWETPVSDLSPLKGVPLTYLECNDTQVSDLSPLQGKNLTDVRLTPKNITKGMDVIRQMKSLNVIGINKDNRLPPAEFWKKYDAGEFGR